MSTETKEPTTEELRAQAIAGEKAPETPPVAPPEPPAPDEAFTLTEGENGQVELKLRTGEVFTGTANEVLRKTAKAKADTTDYAKDLKAQLKDLQDRTQHISDALTPKPPAPTPEEVNAQQLREFLANQQAEYLGFENAAQMKQQLQSINETSAKSRSDRIAMDFMAECPEFPAGDKEVSDKLLDTGAQYGIFRTNAKGELESEPTAKQLIAAHALCVQLGVYKPLTEEQIQQQINAGARVKPKMQARPTPPPMVPGTQPETVQGSNNDPWSMPLGDLRQQIISGQRR